MANEVKPAQTAQPACPLLRFAATLCFAANLNVGARRHIPSAWPTMKRRSKWVVVNDRMQQGYRYELVAAEGEDFELGFEPELTPAKMLELGIFCGVYMRDCQDEFPAAWFSRAKVASGKPDCSLNYFGVRAGSPLSVWRSKGWIHPEDPRGWFQWYCRYYAGRRMEGEDQRQISRWKAFRRHKAQIERHCGAGDPFCRPRQRQALLQWAYDSRAL